MLKFFNRLERTRNFVLILFAVLMVLSLVLFYAPTRDSQASLPTRSTETAAKVGSESVTVGELATQKESLGRFYGGRAPASRLLLDGMIRERMVRLEAARLGLTATDAEVADEIRRQNKPTDGTAFDQKVYEQNVTEQFGSVKAYEQAVRDQVSGQKLEAFITSGVSVSEEAVLDDYKRRNTNFDLTYVPVSVSELAQAIKPSDEELKNYFEQNKKSYYISSPQKKIRYVFVNTTKIGEKLSIPDADLQAEYDKLTPERKQAGVTGQQIVLRVSKPELDAQVLAKANEIVTNLRKDGGKISEERFAEIARGQSEDTRTAYAGAKIPGLVRSNPNNPDDPYQKILPLEEGQVTEPIKFGTSYYILRRGAPVPKSFDEAKKELDVSLRNRRAYTAAADVAQKVADDLKQTKDAQKTAQTFAAQVNSSATDMVRETAFVKPGDDVPNIGISPQFEEGIASLQNVGDVGDKIPVKEGFAIPILVDQRPPHEATFDEVAAQVTEAYKQDAARKQVEQVAKDIAAGATSVSALAAAAQSKGLKAQDAKGYALGSPLGQGASAATSEELENAIYALKAGEVSKTPIKVGDNWYIVGATTRTEADMNNFAKERDELVQSMLAQKRGEVFSDYLSDIRRKMEADGKIKIYKDALDKLDAADTTEAEG